LTETGVATFFAPMPPYWAAVRSLPQRERFATEQLGLRGYETFLPLVATQRASAPLFASYFFCRIVEQWRAINYCFGVLALVRVGDCPCRIPDYEIEALKARADASGIIRLPPPPPPRSQRQFAKGEKVKIVAGQFAHFDAIHSGMRRGDLERVLITILGAQREVTVARHLVAAQ
jgi:transcription antitermination factor NusG